MPFPTVPSIRSSRLELRPVAVQDLPDLLEVNGDPEVTRSLPYDAWRSLADAEAWLARMEAMVAAGTGQVLAIVRRADGKVIGDLLLFKYDEGSARVELGYVLDRAYWREGFMSEAVAAACSAALDELGMRRIEAEVNPENSASCALLERLGFTLEGLLRERWCAKGVAYDTRLYGWLASDRTAAPGPESDLPAEGGARDSPTFAHRKLPGTWSAPGRHRIDPPSSRRRNRNSPEASKLRTVTRETTMHPKTLTAGQRRLSWSLQLLVAAILAQTLFFKFTAAPESVHIFSTLGLEPAGRIGSGIAELLATVLILVPATVVLGALLALGVMAGAIAAHLGPLGIEVQGDGGLLFGLACVVLVASAAVLALRRRELPIVGKRWS